MLRVMLKSKVHRATITESELHYEGSITVDQLLLQAANILPYEQVMVSNLNNGERFTTYALPGRPNSGVICLNGPTARKGMVGDRIILFSYASYEETTLKNFKPVVIEVDDKNRQVIGTNKKKG